MTEALRPITRRQNTIYGWIGIIIVMVCLYMIAGIWWALLFPGFGGYIAALIRANIYRAKGTWP